MNVLCDISGIIGSPMYINNSMNNNLVIDKDKGLELIIYNEDAIIINKDIWNYGTGIKEGATYKRYGRDFDYLSDVYLDFVTKNRNTPIIKRGKDFDYVQFTEEDIEFNNIDICMHHNLVLLDKSSGIANVYYIPPFDALVPSSIKLHDVKNRFNVLQKQMDEDTDPDKYKRIKRSMINLQKNMAALSLKVQEEYAIIAQKEMEKNRKHQEKKKREPSTPGIADDNKPVQRQQ